MQTNQYTQLTEKGDFDRFNGAFLPSVNEVQDTHFKSMLHRRTEQIYSQIRLTRSRLKTYKDRLVFDYILDNTLGRGKTTDQIANIQFVKGKQCTKTGNLIDFGCGLKSIKPIREARKSLIEQGIIFEEKVTDEYGKQQANRYGLTFIRELLELHTSQSKCGVLEKHTPRGYYEKPPTYEYPSDIIKQRCVNTPKKKTERKRTAHYKDSSHVDYLADLMEQGTGDTHSRGAFALIALTVPEGKIMELLSILKDRDNIKNKGAWFLSVSRKYQTMRVIKADAPEPPEKRTEREQVIPPTMSLTEKLLAEKPELADLLDMNRKLQVPATHHKFIVGG